MTHRQTILNYLAARPMRTVSSLIRHGIPHRAIDRAAASGLILRPIHNVVVLASAVDDEVEHHLELAAACWSTGGVVCLRAAAAYHGMTDDLPEVTDLLVGRGRSRAPCGRLSTYRLSRTTVPAALKDGIETLAVVARTAIPITSPARTVVDLYRAGHPGDGDHVRTAALIQFLSTETPATLLKATKPFPHPPLTHLHRDIAAVMAAKAHTPIACTAN